MVLSWCSFVALFCFLCLLRGFSTLVTAGVLRRLLTFLGPSSVCERDVQKEPQQVSQSSAEGTVAACHRPARSRHPHSLTHSCSHPHQHARTPPDARISALPQSPGAPFAEHHYTGAGVLCMLTSSGSTYRGDPPQPAPAPVAGPSPPVHLATC